MANTVIALKKSATPSAVPSNLANGEVAINYADGKLFYKHANGTIIAFNTSGGNSFGTVNANGTLVVADTSSGVLNLVPGNNIYITADSVNDKINIGIIDSPTFIGQTTVSGGKFVVNAIGGDEGGEILLEKPPNGTLNGGITIDSYQNKLRFFEQGGSARGVYIDLSLASAGVGTDLLASSGSTDTTARAAASAAFDKANSANLLAYNVGINTNNYLISVIAGANTAVGAGANAFTSATIAGANTAVGTGANNFASATISGANTISSAAFNKANSANSLAASAYDAANAALAAAVALAIALG